MRKVLPIVALGVILALVLTGAANLGTVKSALASFTGEEDFAQQLHALPEWLSGLVRQQPRTADFVPIAYNGVNPYGINTFLNQEVEVAKRARQLDLIRDAGFRWIRQEFPWEDIEIHAKGDFMDRRNAVPVSAWDKYDGIVRMANERGIQVIPRLSTPPKWSRANPDAIATTPPDNLNDFGDFVEAVVRRYKGQIRFYQIWNEPNVYPEWGDQAISPEGYVALLKVAYARAKAADPDAVIISAPLAPTIELGPRDMNDFVFLQRMYDAGAKNYFDIMSINDYGLWSGATDKRMRPRVLNFSRPIYIRDIMVQNGDEHKAIWASEIGWNAIPLDSPALPSFGRASDAQVARNVPAAYERAQAEWPWMGMMAYWFFKRASDAEKDQAFYYFKMLDPDFTPMPVYEAMKQEANRAPLVYPGYFQEDHWAIQANVLRQAQDAAWPTINDPRAVLGKYRRSAQAGDSLTFSFRGSRLDLVFVRGPQSGTAQVTIDDRAPVEVTLISATDAFGQPTTLAIGLPAGTHRVTLKSLAPPVGFDALIVYP